MSSWTLHYDGYDPSEQGLRETLLTVGNGAFATRGALSESAAGETHYPGTYLAGIYNRLTSHVAGESVTNEALVNAPNWLVVRIAVNGVWLTVDEAEVVEHAQELDMRRGLMLRRTRLRDEDGRTTRIVERRFAHMAHRHLGVQEVTVVPEDWDGTIRIQTGIDGSVENTGVARYSALASKHLDLIDVEETAPDTILLRTETNGSHLRIGQAVRSRFYAEQQQIHPARTVSSDDGLAVHEVSLDVTQDGEIRLEKVMAVHTTHDPAVYEPGRDARAATEAAGDVGTLLQTHTLAWAQLWDRFRFELEVDGDIPQIVRLHLYHLLTTVSPNSQELDAGVPPRGLHGEAYRGLIMWDELFVFPLIDLRLPAVSRALLAYRYRRLPEARRAAAGAGHAGAMFPWQSGSNGEEMAQEIHLNPESGRWLPDPTERQRHIGLAVAYNVWTHYQSTGDVRFLADQGAEMMLEIARFFASLTSFDHGSGRYEICGVLGPDEFHTAYPDRNEPGLDNNAYTNVMTSWLFRRVCELAEIMPPDRWTELRETLGVDRDELEHWREISEKLVVPFHDDGIISQFSGYEDLEELDWDGLREQHGDIGRLDRILEAQDDSPNRYKASKQADVLMLFYLFSADELDDLFAHLGYEWSTDRIPATIEYYLERTTHGSTLSACVHAWVLARSRRDEAYDYFVRALQSDIADVQGGTTPEGIHLGAMAGSVDLLQRCFTGLERRGDQLFVNPFWPPELGVLEFDIVYRGHPLSLRVSGELVRVASAPGDRPPITINCRGETIELRPGDTVELHA